MTWISQLRAAGKDILLIRNPHRIKQLLPKRKRMNFSPVLIGLFKGDSLSGLRP
ncbi:MAG: hypothetical protein ABF293_12805 [Flavobacteriaceae bacterium]